MTASPVGSMLATSNVGTPSPLPDGGDPISASTTAFASDLAFASDAALCSRASDAGFEIAGAVIAAMVSAGGSRRMEGTSPRREG